MLNSQKLVIKRNYYGENIILYDIRRTIMPNGWVKCPRCELNYIREGEEYCEVCKAELRKGPELLFAIDDEDVRSERAHV